MTNLEACHSSSVISPFCFTFLLVVAVLGNTLVMKVIMTLYETHCLEHVGSAALYASWVSFTHAALWFSQRPFTRPACQFPGMRTCGALPAFNVRVRAGGWLGCRIEQKCPPRNKQTRSCASMGISGNHPGQHHHLESPQGGTSGVTDWTAKSYI